MDKPKILVCDGVDKAGVDILKEHFEVEERKKLEEPELVSLLSSKDFSGIIVRSATKITSKAIESSKSLKVIGRAGIGVDNIDVKSATEKGIVVMNTLGAANTTAEHTIALIFSVARKIPQAHISVKNGKWEKEKFVGRELFGKTIGVIGLGNIGKRVAEIAKGIGMRVIFYDPYVDDPRFEKKSFEELIENSDIITVHVPLSDKTKGMIGEKEFERMKNGVIIINCARGGIIDEKALAKYIDNGKVLGAGVDVFSKEPITPDNPLLEKENVVLTPHLGASTVEGQRNASVEIAQKIVKFLKYGIIEDAVNFFPIPEDKRLVFELSEKLGSFASQAFAYAIKEIKIVSSSQDEMHITKAGVLFGFLKNIIGSEMVTPLNAEKIAKSKGITVAEKQQVSGDYKTKITVQIVSDKGEFSVSGAIVGKSLRFIEINSIQLEAPAEGNIIFSQNEDVPGVVGRIGTFLGEKNINIASIHLGREKPGGKAIALISVDQMPDKEIIKQLESLPNIIRASFIKL